MGKTIQEIIDEIKEKLDLLIEKDKFLLLFGATSHKYLKLPPFTLDEIDIFESKLQISLPDDFKAFITQVISGGAGPSYGFYSMKKLFEDIEKSGKYSALSQEFGGKMYIDDVEYVSIGSEISDCDNIFSRDKNIIIPGSIPFSNMGCAMATLLVLQGPEKGNIWIDAALDGVLPPNYPDNKKITFTEYYLNWLNRGLEIIGAYDQQNVYPTDYQIVEQILQNYLNQINSKPIEVLLQNISRHTSFLKVPDFGEINREDLIIDVFPDARRFKLPIKRNFYKLFVRKKNSSLQGSINLLIIDSNSSNEIIALEFYNSGYDIPIEITQIPKLTDIRLKGIILPDEVVEILEETKTLEIKKFENKNWEIVHIADKNKITDTKKEFEKNEGESLVDKIERSIREISIYSEYSNILNLVGNVDESQFGNILFELLCLGKIREGNLGFYGWNKWYEKNKKFKEEKNKELEGKENSAILNNLEFEDGESLESKIEKILKTIDSDYGVEFDVLVKLVGSVDESKVDDILFELAYEGKVYQPRPDYYKWHS